MVCCVSAACRHALGVSSGTTALELVLRALGVGAGDEVIIPANTFVATGASVVAPAPRRCWWTSTSASGNLDPAPLERGDHAADESDRAGASVRPAGAR